MTLSLLIHNRHLAKGGVMYHSYRCSINYALLSHSPEYIHTKVVEVVGDTHDSHFDSKVVRRSLKTSTAF